MMAAIIKDGIVTYSEVSDNDAIVPKENYSTRVEQYIRRIYSISDELAILRQRDEKPSEYQQYYEYCEQCKQEAKQELGLV